MQADLLKVCRRVSLRRCGVYVEHCCTCDMLWMQAEGAFLARRLDKKRKSTEKVVCRNPRTDTERPLVTT